MPDGCRDVHSGCVDVYKGGIDVLKGSLCAKGKYFCAYGGVDVPQKVVDVFRGDCAWSTSDLLIYLHANG